MVEEKNIKYSVRLVLEKTAEIQISNQWIELHTSDIKSKELFRSNNEGVSIKYFENILRKLLEKCR